MKNNQNNRVVLVVPYFGRIPAYFDLWLRSAEKNPDFTFFIYSDLPFPVSEDSNVKLKHITFSEVQDRIHEKFGKHCKIKEPYKLCDYKAAYGAIFEEDLTDFEFWGFCDIDVILGNLRNFVTDDLLDNHDKLFFLGHFCIMRNNQKMRYLFMEKYPRVIDFGYVSRTNYCCHSDENGAIAYAPEYDSSIRFHTGWPFFDVWFADYPMMDRGSEAYAIWDNGVLMYHNPAAEKHHEIMYIHLQKRTMTGMETITESSFAIFRTAFANASLFDSKTVADMPIDEQVEQAYYIQRKKRRIKDILRKVKQGALKYRLFRRIYRWQEK